MTVLCPKAGLLAFTPPGGETSEVVSRGLPHRQLWVSNLSKVATHWLEVDSNLQPLVARHRTYRYTTTSLSLVTCIKLKCWFIETYKQWVQELFKVNKFQKKQIIKVFLSNSNVQSCVLCSLSSLLLLLVLHCFRPCFSADRYLIYAKGAKDLTGRKIAKWKTIGLRHCNCKAFDTCGKPQGLLVYGREIFL